MSEQADKGRSAVQQIVDKISNDAAFRQQLVNEPAKALQDLGLGGQDVSGYMLKTCSETCGTNPDGGTGTTCHGTCRPDSPTQS